MAIMRPERMEDLSNKRGIDREDEVYAWLRDNLPDTAVVLHEPALYDRRRRLKRPDFLVFWERTDCLAIEVKNWKLENIVDGDGLKVRIRPKGTDIVSTTHPMRQAQDMQYAIMHHFEREHAGNPDFVVQEGDYLGKLTFCVTPLVIMLGADEADREEICRKIKGMDPNFLITEEALTHADTLRARFCNLPFARPLLGERSVLHAAADSIFPPLKSASEIEEEMLDRAEAMVPEVVCGVQTAPDRESETDRYKRLRGDLMSVAASAAELIAAERGDGSRQVAELENIVDALREDVFKVGVFGVTGAGKSTFINALLQERLMRSGLGETSKTVTWLHAADEAHPHGTCRIHVKTVDEVNQELAGYLLETGFLDQEFDEEGMLEQLDVRDALVRQKLSSWVGGEFSESRGRVRAAVTYIRALLAGWEEFGERLGDVMRGSFDEFNELVHAEHRAVFVRRRDAYIANDLLKEGFVFVDSPGVGSSLNRHTDLAMQCARDVDAALMLTKVDYQFMPPDREFVKNALDVQRHRQYRNLFFVLNQIKHIKPLEKGKTPEQFDECVAEECDRLSDRLADEGISGFDIYPVDSLCALYASRAAQGVLAEAELGEYDQAALVDWKADLPDPEKNLRASRFPDMIVDLRRKLSRIKYHGFLGIKLDGLRTAVEGFQAGIEGDIKGLSQDIERIESELEEHHKNREYVRSKLDKYLPVFQRDVENLYADLFDEKDADGNVLRDGEIAGVIKVCAQSAAKHYQKFFVSKGRFLDAVRAQVQEDTVAALRYLRNKYEGEYKKLRDDVLQIHLREQVAAYAQLREWEFRTRHIEYAEQKTIKGIEKLDIPLYLKLFEMIRTWNKEERTEKLADRFGEAFKKQLHGPFAEDVVGWIEEDSQHLETQIREIFEQVSGDIEERINSQLEERNSKSSEREARKRQLMRYRKEVDKLMEQLGELEDQIRAAQPANP